MNIRILGTGCKKCQVLHRNVEEAVGELNLQADIEKVEDIMEIMKYNVISTPGLMINEDVVSFGRVLTVKQIKELLTKNQ